MPVVFVPALRALVCVPELRGACSASLVTGDDDPTCLDSIRHGHAEQADEEALQVRAKANEFELELTGGW